jgi:serine/threonine-protein kinase
MGAVWRARHARLPRPVAIKVLHEHAYESEEILLRFRREAEITSQLGHPHIVEVFDFNVLEDGRAYLVMELLDGQSLRERLKRGPPLAPEEALEMLDQVAGALAHAHRAGVVHRDLKPENIFLVAGREGRVHAKVLDFGISKMQGAHTVITQGASLMGTPRYMSPEQARGGTAEVDGRADQFSLGAIAYEILAGRPAFAGESVTQVLLRVLEEAPEPLARVAPGVSPHAAGAVERALAKARDARFPDMDGFRRALLGSGEVATPPARRKRPVSMAHTDPDALEDTVQRPRSEPSPAPRRRRPRLVAAFAVVALGAGMGWGLREGLVSDGALGPGVAADPGTRTSTAATTETAAAAAVAGAPDASRAGTFGDRAAGAADASSAGMPSGRAAGAPDAGAKRGAQRRRPVRPKPLPPRLLEAERVLRQGQYDAALREAERSLRDEDDPRAFAVMAIASCGKRDLASARAHFRRTPRRARRRVRRACAALGTELRP